MQAQPLAGLADEPGPAAASGAPATQFVTFTCDGRAYGLDIMAVREIRSWTPVTSLPKQTVGAVGVLDIRGRTVEVYDLAALLGGVTRAGAPGQVVLVASLPKADIGLVVDTVSDIIFPTAENLRDPPASADRLVTALIKSGDQLIGILDLSSLFPAQSAGELVYV